MENSPKGNFLQMTGGGSCPGSVCDALVLQIQYKQRHDKNCMAEKPGNGTFHVHINYYPIIATDTSLSVRMIISYYCIVMGSVINFWKYSSPDTWRLSTVLYTEFLMS